MDFRDSPDEAVFRSRVTGWIDRQRPILPMPEDDEGRIAYLSDLQARMHEAGLTALSFPVEYGGRGLSAEHEGILLEELGRAGLPSAWHYGYIARVILLYGTEDQKRRFLPPAFEGAERWCQGFSEPGAGSDLGALGTRGVLRDDRYVVNGQKVWTSEAKWADWCLLLVRTEEGVPNHRSMSCFVVPVDSPGLTVRPFRQITGAMEFSELFLDDLEIPVANLVGAPGQGWQIAMSTVSFERGPGDVGDLADLRASLGRLAALVEGPDPWPGDGAFGADGEAGQPGAARRAAVLEVSRMRVELEVLRVHIATSLSRQSKGLSSEAEASVDKLLMVRTQQALGHAVLDVLGAGPLLGDEPEALFQYLWSRAASVYGGSEQIQRTLVATRMLGLPRGA